MEEPRAPTRQLPADPPPPLPRSLPLLLTLAVILTYAPVLAHDFTNWDDHETIAFNPNLNPPTLDGLLHHWRHPHMSLYIPATYTTWWLLASVAQVSPDDIGIRLNPSIFHLANLLVHLAATLILLTLLWNLVRNAFAAAAGAALFALHPVQVEPVAWISGMKDLLSGLLALLALWQYLLCARRDTLDRTAWTHYAIATIALLLAILAKPAAVVVPLMAIVLDLAILRRPLPRAALTLLPWLILILPSIILTILVQPIHEGQTVVTPPWARPLIAADALAFYLYKLLWPAHLAVDYGRSPDRILQTSWIYLTWLLPAAVALLLWLRRKRDPLLLPGAALFLLGVSPVLGFIPFDFQRISTVADHYLYLSMIGAALILAGIVLRLPARPIPRGILIALLLALAVRSCFQTRHWHSSISLFTHTLAVNEHSTAARNNLATDLLMRGHPDQALPYATEAVRLDPDDPRARTTLGAVYASIGEIEIAAQHYERALQIWPDDVLIRTNYAGALATMGRLEEAIHHYELVLQIDPNHVPARRDLHQARQELHQLQPQ